MCRISKDISEHCFVGTRCSALSYKRQTYARKTIAPFERSRSYAFYAVWYDYRLNRCVVCKSGSRYCNYFYAPDLFRNLNDSTATRISRNRNSACCRSISKVRRYRVTRPISIHRFVLRRHCRIRIRNRQTDIRIQTAESIAIPRRPTRCVDSRLILLTNNIIRTAVTYNRYGIIVSCVVIIYRTRTVGIYINRLNGRSGKARVILNARRYRRIGSTS